MKSNNPFALTSKPLERKGKQTMAKRSPKCSSSRRCLCGDQRYDRKVAMPSMYFGDNNRSSEDDCDIFDIIHKAHYEVREYDPIARPLTEKIVRRAKKELGELSLEATSTPARFDLDEISVGVLLGTGGFSDVYEIVTFNQKTKKHYSEAEEKSRSELVTCCRRAAKDHCGPYALKQLRRKLVDNTKKFSNGAIDLTLEAAFLASLDHPNLLNIHGVASDGAAGYLTGRHDGYFLIVDRLSETLQDRIMTWRKRRKKLNTRLGRLMDKQGKKLDKLMEERLKVAFDIASALNYLHSRNLVYRDLKPSNIGFCLDNVVKLFDFGLCRELPAGAERSMDKVFSMSGGVGTYRYMSPEVSKKEKYNQGADVFSFGIVLYEILALNVPSIQHGSKTVDPDQLRMCLCWPDPIKHLLFRTWAATIAERPTMQEVCILLKKEIVRLRGGDDTGLALPVYDKRGNQIIDMSQVPKRFASLRLDEATIEAWSKGSTRSLHTSFSTVATSQRFLPTSAEFQGIGE